MSQRPKIPKATIPSGSPIPKPSLADEYPLHTAHAVCVGHVALTVDTGQEVVAVLFGNVVFVASTANGSLKVIVVLLKQLLALSGATSDSSAKVMSTH